MILGMFGRSARVPGSAWPCCSVPSCAQLIGVGTRETSTVRLRPVHPPGEKRRRQRGQQPAGARPAPQTPGQRTRTPPAARESLRQREAAQSGLCTSENHVPEAGAACVQHTKRCMAPSLKWVARAGPSQQCHAAQPLSERASPTPRIPPSRSCMKRDDISNLNSSQGSRREKVRTIAAAARVSMDCGRVGSGKGGNLEGVCAGITRRSGQRPSGHKPVGSTSCRSLGSRRRARRCPGPLTLLPGCTAHKPLESRPRARRCT